MKLEHISADLLIDILTERNFIMSKFTFNTNNNRIITMEQSQHDGHISVTTGTRHATDGHYIISAGEMVMLLNYFQNCKNGTETSDYILKD